MNSNLLMRNWVMGAGSCWVLEETRLSQIEEWPCPHPVWEQLWACEPQSVGSHQPMCSIQDHVRLHVSLSNMIRRLCLTLIFYSGGPWPLEYFQARRRDISWHREYLGIGTSNYSKNTVYLLQHEHYLLQRYQTLIWKTHDSTDSHLNPESAFDFKCHSP